MTSLNNLFRGPWMDGIREKMLKGERVDGCTRCYQEEDAGKKSLRQRQNENISIPIDEFVDIHQPEIRWLELAISNACNLACRMCDSRYSRKWFDEEKAIYGFTVSPTKISKTNIEETFPFLQSLVHLKFTGGEPLVTREHWQLLEKLTKERDCKDIFLNYSTNCTIYPKENWVKLWDQFKHVEFALSFDSSDKLESEYIRWPESFETIEKTTKAFLELGKSPHYRNILRTTVSVLNVWNLPETILWWIENNKAEKMKINPTHLSYPAFLSITVLPAPIKELISDKFDRYIAGDFPEVLKKVLSYIKNHMMSKDESCRLPNLREYLRSTDLYRNQDFFAAYPQFEKIFDGVKPLPTDMPILSSRRVHNSP